MKTCWIWIYGDGGTVYVMCTVELELFFWMIWLLSSTAHLSAYSEEGASNDRNGKRRWCALRTVESTWLATCNSLVMTRVRGCGREHIARILEQVGTSWWPPPPLLWPHSSLNSLGILWMDLVDSCRARNRLRITQHEKYTALLTNCKCSQSRLGSTNYTTIVSLNI